MKTLGLVLLVLVLGAAVVWVAQRMDRQISAPPANALLAQLEETDKALWERTVRTLAATRYVPELVDALDHSNRRVREGAAHALGDIGPDAAAAVDPLIARLPVEEDDFVRWKLIRALGMIGPAAHEALPLLQPIADDPKQTEIIRASAQAAVARIAGE